MNAAKSKKKRAPRCCEVIPSSLRGIQSVCNAALVGSSVAAKLLTLAVTGELAQRVVEVEELHACRYDDLNRCAL